MTEHDTKDYEHVWPPYGDGAAQPLRSFDLRTTPERMQTWCESLERRIGEMQTEIDGLHRMAELQGEILQSEMEIASHALSLVSSAEERLMHLECALHRLLNPSEEPDADEVME